MQQVRECPRDTLASGTLVFMRTAAVVAALLVPPTASAAPPTTESVVIRGRPQSVRVYGTRGAPVAIVASGDGGWIHLGPYVAEFLSGHGYFVVGFDSKAYLSSFTKGDKTLNTTDVPGDFAALVDYASQGGSTPPVLLGVSEGAALAVLAATRDTTKARLAGVDRARLARPGGARLALPGLGHLLTKGVPKEPLFSTAEVIDTVAPLPLVAIHSTKDEFVSVDDYPAGDESGARAEAALAHRGRRPPLQRQGTGARPEAHGCHRMDQGPSALSAESIETSGAGRAVLRPAAVAAGAGLAVFVVGTAVESLIIRAVHGDRRELEWLSDAVVSIGGDRRSPTSGFT